MWIRWKGKLPGYWEWWLSLLQVAFHSPFSQESQPLVYSWVPGPLQLSVLMIHCVPQLNRSPFLPCCVTKMFILSCLRCRWPKSSPKNAKSESVHVSSVVPVLFYDDSIPLKWPSRFSLSTDSKSALECWGWNLWKASSAETVPAPCQINRRLVTGVSRSCGMVHVGERSVPCPGWHWWQMSGNWRGPR